MAAAPRAVAERIFLVGTILLLGWLTFRIFQPFFPWVILGFLFSYLFYGVYQRTLPQMKRRGIAAGLVLLLVLFVFFMPLIILLAFFFQDIRLFAESLQSMNYEAIVRSLVEAVSGAFGVQVDSVTLDQMSENVGRSLRDAAADLLRGIATNLVPVVAQLLIGLFIFGFTGFVVGPLVLSLFVAVLRVYRLHWRGDELHDRTMTVAQARAHIGRMTPGSKKGRVRRTTRSRKTTG